MKDQIATVMRNTTSHLRSSLFALLALGTVLSACTKDEESPLPTPPTGGSSSSPSTTPNFPDADGLLAAVRVNSTQSTPIGPIDIILGLATGGFTNDGFSSFVNAGAVSCNGEVLTLQGNNSYVYQPSATNPTGIDLTASNEVTWNVAGGNGFPDFQRTIAGPFPTTGDITSAATVVRADGYTVSTTNVLNADSVIFLLGELSRTLPGNAASCSFSASELSALAAGSSIVQVSAYRSTNELIAGERIYFVKQSSRSLSVNIQ